MRVATPESWFETESVSDDLTLIYEPHVVAFTRCNIWHVRGRDQDLLVDSGLGVVSLRQQIPLVTERSLSAVATHFHFDHIGGMHEFESRLIHAEEAKLLADPSADNVFAGDSIFSQLPPGPFRSTEYKVRSAPATRTVGDGDIIDLGDRHFEVIHTPGHSPGSISLWEESTGILFSGDTIYDGPLFDGDYVGQRSDYVASLERLIALPVSVVHGGHFASFGRQRFRDLIETWLVLWSRA
ncbi:MAG: MBL fold metallo-hydrolase [Pseudomonadota bacterium]